MENTHTHVHTLLVSPFCFAGDFHSSPHSGTERVIVSCVMSPKVSLAVLIALLAVATALAATAHAANQNGEDFFAKVKSVFVEDGKVNTIPAGVVAVIVLAITALVRSL